MQKGSRIFKGTIVAEAGNKLGTQAGEQPLNFSASIQKAGEGAMLFGGNPAWLTGTIIHELAPYAEFGLE
jgi:hypothetical protein